MCNLPIYKEVKDNPAYNNRMILPDTAHAGLWYDKFFNQFDGSWVVPKPGKKEEEPGGRVAWINSVTGKVGDKAKIQEYAKRTKDLIKALGGYVRDFQTEWNFVTGLGLAHPVENGFAWHRTLGVPYLTGAAVKGMLLAWCTDWDGMNKETVLLWFGGKNEKGKPCAGELIFFDAVPTGPVELIRDVMTPHMGQWYKDGGKPNSKDIPVGSNVPADWHDPNPIPFLAVAPDAEFQFAIGKRPGFAIDMKVVMDTLKDALANIGAGAKTAAGYGRFMEVG